MSYEIPLMFGLAVISVSMWTLRVTVAASGRRAASALVAALEAVVFVLTFSHLVADLSSPTRLASYAAGVAIGTAVGLYVNDRTSGRSVELTIVAPGESNPVVGVLHECGWPATTTGAQGPNGAVTQVMLTVGSRDARSVLELVRSAAPDAFMTSRALSSAVNAAPRGTPSVRAIARRCARRGSLASAM